MLLALGVVCFVFGFLVALIVSTKSNERHDFIARASPAFSHSAGDRKRGSLRLESAANSDSEILLQKEDAQLLTK